MLSPFGLKHENIRRLKKLKLSRMVGKVIKLKPRLVLDRLDYDILNQISPNSTWSVVDEVNLNIIQISRLTVLSTPQGLTVGSILSRPSPNEIYLKKGHF